MGLTIYNAFSGSYGTFGMMLRYLANLSGYANDVYSDQRVMPYLGDHEKLIGKWDHIPFDPLLILFTHSDCDGYLHWSYCKDLGNRILQVIEKDPSKYDAENFIYKKAKLFADGLISAHEEKLTLHFT